MITENFDLAEVILKQYLNQTESSPHLCLLVQKIGQESFDYLQNHARFLGSKMVGRPYLKYPRFLYLCGDYVLELDLKRQPNALEIEFSGNSHFVADVLNGTNNRYDIEMESGKAAQFFRLLIGFIQLLPKNLSVLMITNDESKKDIYQRLSELTKRRIFTSLNDIK